MRISIRYVALLIVLVVVVLLAQILTGPSRSSAASDEYFLRPGESVIVSLPPDILAGLTQSNLYPSKTTLVKGVDLLDSLQALDQLELGGATPRSVISEPGTGIRYHIYDPGKRNVRIYSGFPFVQYAVEDSAYRNEEGLVLLYGLTIKNDISSKSLLFGVPWYFANRFPTRDEVVPPVTYTRVTDGIKVTANDYGVAPDQVEVIFFTSEGSHVVKLSFLQLAGPEYAGPDYGGSDSAGPEYGGSEYSASQSSSFQSSSFESASSESPSFMPTPSPPGLQDALRKALSSSSSGLEARLRKEMEKAIDEAEATSSVPQEIIDKARDILDISKDEEEDYFTGSSLSAWLSSQGEGSSQPSYPAPEEDLPPPSSSPGSSSSSEGCPPCACGKNGETSDERCVERDPKTKKISKLKAKCTENILKTAEWAVGDIANDRECLRVNNDSTGDGVYGCAATVNSVLDLALCGMITRLGKGPGTATAGMLAKLTYSQAEAAASKKAKENPEKKYLQDRKDDNWCEVDGPGPGVVVLSATYEKDGKRVVGHVGIGARGDRIMSNSSYGCNSTKNEKGQKLAGWANNYSHAGWIAKFGRKFGESGKGNGTRYFQWCGPCVCKNKNIEKRACS